MFFDLESVSSHFVASFCNLWSLLLTTTVSVAQYQRLYIGVCISVSVYWCLYIGVCTGLISKANSIGPTTRIDTGLEKNSVCG